MSLSTYLRTGFYPLSFFLPENELLKRVQDNWSNLGIVSGLISGFTFLVISQEVTFVVPFNGSLSREEIFTICTGLSFVFALCATLMCSYMHGIVNIGGQQQVRELVQKWCIIFGFPLYCTVISIFGLLIAAFFAVGGRYSSQIVWLTILSAGALLTLVMIVVFFCMLHGSYKRIDQEFERWNRERNTSNMKGVTSISNTATLAALGTVQDDEL